MVPVADGGDLVGDRLVGGHDVAQGVEVGAVKAEVEVTGTAATAGTRPGEGMSSSPRTSRCG
jgi:hypothetical protein